MRRFRTHIGTLLLAVLVMGIALAALRESNEIWDASVFTLTIGILLTSVLLALYRRERQRAFWVGFALFGAVYLGLSAIPSVESRLITTKLLIYLESKVHRPVLNAMGLAYADFDADGSLDLLVSNASQPNKVYATQANGVFQDVSASIGLTMLGNQVVLNSPTGLRLGGTAEHFLRIGHSLLALMAALIGARISGHLFARSRQPAQAMPANEMTTA